MTIYPTMQKNSLEQKKAARRLLLFIPFKAGLLRLQFYLHIAFDRF